MTSRHLKFPFCIAAMARISMGMTAHKFIWPVLEA